MKKILFFSFLTFSIITCNTLYPQETIKLLPPSKKGTMTLSEALNTRKSTRDFTEEK